MHKLFLELLFLFFLLSQNTFANNLSLSTSNSNVKSSVSQKKFIILTIDGGGVRGVVAARILDEIEKRTGKQIHEMVDIISGNSTGGIIALALVVPNGNGKAKYSASDLVDLYMLRSQEIFPVSYWHKAKTGFGLWGARYDRSGLDNILKEKFSNSLLSDTLKPVIVISYSLDRSSPHIWSTYAINNKKSPNNYFLRDIAGATSAAPTYFSPKIITGYDGGACYLNSEANGTKTLCYEADGGIYANNPSIVALTSAYKFNPGIGREDIVLISIGTGSVSLSKEVDKLKNDGVTGWLLDANLIDVMMSAEGDILEWESEILGINTKRLQVKLDQHLGSMDDASSSHMNALLTATETFIKNNSSAIDEICKILSTNVISDNLEVDTYDRKL